MPQEFNASMARFRAPGGLIFNYMLSQVERYETSSGTVQFLPASSVTKFIPMNDNTHSLRRALTNLLDDHRTKFLCINDDVKNPSRDHVVILSNFFEQLLNRTR
mmetsp:Transcript_29668/g.43855  ORF Transcript_29668/g.43855 Transcript_29668/m.43855 type:complete len:104 (+) Transcript_29668:2-313(+)